MKYSGDMQIISTMAVKTGIISPRAARTDTVQSYQGSQRIFPSEESKTLSLIKQRQCSEKKETLDGYCLLYEQHPNGRR